jgi:hypothetical protein
MPIHGYALRSLRQRKNFFAFCFAVFASVSRPVREALAFDAFGDKRRTFPIENLACVELEIPFRETAGQMGFANRMMRPEHGSLHQAESAFRSVDVNEAAKPGVFIGRMIDRPVAGKLAADRSI